VIDRIGTELCEVTEEIRRIAHGLRPTALDMVGHASAIESHARAVAETTEIVVQYRPRGY
jgi:signal transduction histidine kinase